MSRSYKIITGILSFLPAVLLVIYIISIFSVAFHSAFVRPHEEDPFTLFSDFFWVMAIGIMMGIISIALMIYFCIQVVNNKQMEGTERLMWVLLFIFVSTVSLPLFWYMRIWKTPTTTNLA